MEPNQVTLPALGDASSSLVAAAAKGMFPVGMIVSDYWLPRREHAMFAGHVDAALATMAESA